MNAPKTLHDLKAGDWLVDLDDGRCHQLTGKDQVGKMGRLFPDSGLLYFGGRKKVRVRPATAADLAAWREHEAKKEAEAKAEYEKWLADNRKRDAANVLYVALKSLMSAVEEDAKEKGISGLTGAAMCDARHAIEKADGTK